MAEEIFFALNLETGQPIKTIGDLKTQTKLLKKELDGVEVGSDRFQDLQVQIEENNKQIKAFNSSISGTGSFTKKVGQSISNSFKQIGQSILTSLGPIALAGTIVAGTKKLVEFQQQLEKTRREVNQLTGATGERLDDVTSRVSALSKTFDKDFNQVLIASNSLANQMGISIEEATDLIGKGFVAGADVSGEFLDTLKEYPAQFQAVGLSADESVAIITRSVQEGIFSDKGVDAIKEAGIRLREFTPATKEALDNIGISGTELQKQIESGSITTFEAIQKVSNRLGELPAQSNEVGTAIADIFGGAGEDAGLEYLKLIGQIDGGIDGLIDKTNEFQNAQLELLDANRRLDKIFNDVLGGADGLFTQINAGFKTFIANTLESMINGFVTLANVIIDLQNESAAFRLIWELGGASINTIIRAIKLNFNLLIGGFKSAGRFGKAFFLSLEEGFEALRAGNFTGIGDAFSRNFSEALKNSAKEIASDIKNFAVTTAEDFNNAINNALSPKEKIAPFTFNNDDKEQIVKNAKDTASSKVKASANQERKLSIAERKKLQAELQVLEDQFFNETEETRLQDMIEFLEAERDLQLENANLTSEERLIIEQQTANKIKELNIKANEDRLESEREIQNSRINAAKSATDALINLFGEESRIGKQALGIQKGLALAEVALNLQKELAAIDANLFRNALPPGLAQASKTAARFQAVAKAATILASIKSIKFQDGGILDGPSHAQGGVPITMASGGMVEAEGGEAIINRRSTALFKPLLSALNHAGGGKKFQDGGITPNVLPSVNTSASQLISSFNRINFNPIVSVEEFERVKTNVDIVEQLSRI